MSRVLLTARQQLERVADARREAIMRGNPDILTEEARLMRMPLRYKPHLRMRISKPLKVDMSPLSPRRSVSIDWLRPLPDGSVRVHRLCDFWDYIPANGWQLVRQETSHEYEYKAARLRRAGFFGWLGGDT